MRQDEWRPIPKLPTEIITQALCKNAPIDWFFPAKGYISVGKSLCTKCPVQQQCLEYALDNSVHYGTWGNTNERQRHKIRQQRKKTENNN